MTQKRSKKSILFIISCVAMMIIGSTTMCFADEASTPAHINVEATSVSFEITEKINMTAKANSTDMTVDSLEVYNKSDVGVLKIDSIEAEAVGGWTLAPVEGTDWEKLGTTAKTFGLIADGINDMTNAYTGAGTVDPGATDTTTFTGKTGMVVTAVTDEQAGKLVVTISYVE